MSVNISRIARVAMTCAALCPCALAAQGDWSAVTQALGRPGTEQPGGVVRFAFPRSDLHVTVDGVPVRPGLALGSWIAFRRARAGGAMAMGDLVLTQDEAAPVIARLAQGGIQPSAVHNHLLREQPRIVYVHLDAHGDAAQIARTVRAALALTHTPMAAPAASAPAPFGLDTAALARALGRSGRVNGGVWQVSVPRAEAVMEHGDTVPPAMGVATALNLQPTSGGRAVATGDFVMTEGEVAGVLRALDQNGIGLTALHSHMVGEQPHLYFAHFWGNGDAMRIAAGLHAALAAMNVR
jgi:hypothetical protein